MIDEQDFVKFPLCVDLDGTLCSGDCLYLSIKLFLKKYPYRIFQLLVWRIKGNQILKYNLSKYVHFEAAALHFFPIILDYLHQLKSNGAKLYLVTGADQKIADQVAKHLQIFEQAFGSSKYINLVAENKATLLNKLFGKGKYIYFGNEWKDRLVWQYSAAAVAVNVSEKTKLWLTQHMIYTRYFTVT